MVRIKTLIDDLMEICDLPSAAGQAMLFCVFFHFLEIPGLNWPNAIPSDQLLARQIALLTGAVMTFLVIQHIKKCIAPTIPVSVFVGAICTTLGIVSLGFYDVLGTSYQLPSLGVSWLIGVGSSLLLLAWSVDNARLAIRRRVAATATSVIIACFLTIIFTLIGELFSSL